MILKRERISSNLTSHSLAYNVKSFEEYFHVFLRLSFQLCKSKYLMQKIGIFNIACRYSRNSLKRNLWFRQIYSQVVFKT